MEIQSKKTREIITVTDEKWAALKRMGWNLTWFPVKKAMDEDMMAKIYGAEKIEMPIELKPMAQQIEEQNS